jgi:hypothetical protein
VFDNTGQKFNRYWVAQQARSVFARESKSPWTTFAKFAMCTATGLVLAYPALLTLSDPVTQRAWVTAAQPVVDAVATLVPSVSNLSQDLIRRGYAGRVPYVADVIAMQWLIMGLGAVVSAVAISGEGSRLKRALAMARAERLKSPVGNQGSWLRWIRIPVLLVLIAWTPFNGWSRNTGSYTYDLATSDFGFFFFACLVAFWWWAAFWGWQRLLAMLARSPGTEESQAATD